MLTRSSPILSIVSDSKLEYPAGYECYSPSTKYPEYRHQHIASRPNWVYDAVRRIFAQASLDSERFGSPEWNPLGCFIPAGSTVFVLCNFVTHRHCNEDQQSFFAKCTHGSILRAVVDYVLIAIGNKGKVRFGNAPLQSCRWESVLRDTGADRVIAFFEDRNISVSALDLRNFVAERNLLGGVRDVEERGGKNVVEIDLGRASLLSVFDEDKPKFRVTDYDPGRTETYQNPNRHVYAINQAILESDTIFSVPKLKTHEKVGITCALKGMVGTIACKDSLAHHRSGPPCRGGDEYPTDSRFLQFLSEFHDGTYRFRRSGSKFRKLIDMNLRRIARKCGQTLGGAWHGNDTAWRMTLDIARIVTYADKCGTLCATPQRLHLALVDGVIAGEGNGPLAPIPVQSGKLLFSDDLVLLDQACCAVMGFDANSIPLIREAAKLQELPLCNPDTLSGTAFVNDSRVTLPDISLACTHVFKPPPGWIGHMQTSTVTR